MTQSTPTAIIAACAIWLLAISYEVIVLFKQPMLPSGWFQFFFPAITAGWLASLFGLWKMKKWGILLFANLFAINQFILIWGNEWDMNTVLLPALVMVVGFAHFNRMT